MQVQLPNCMVLEIFQKTVKKKNKAGEWEPTGETQPHVVAYPMGQGDRPGVVIAKIQDNKAVEEIAKYKGQFVTLGLDQRSGDSGNFYTFHSISKAA